MEIKIIKNKIIILNLMNSDDIYLQHNYSSMFPHILFCNDTNSPYYYKNLINNELAKNKFLLLQNE